MQEYKQVSHELRVVGGTVLRGDRIVIPAKLRQRMIEIAHEGHQGRVRTKQLTMEGASVVPGNRLPM